MNDAAAAPSRQHGSHEYQHLAPLFDELVALHAEDPRRATVRDELIAGYRPLAEHIAQRFAGRGTPKEDLVQVASVGLINAVDRFDPSQGNDFLSYAVPTIMGEVRRYFRDASWSMRVPRRLKELHLSVSNAGTTLAQRLGRAAKPSEISEYLGISIDEVYQGLEVGQAYHSMSLDESLTNDEGGAALAESVGEEETGFAGVDNHESLVPLMRSLPERERRIIGLRFFHNMTQTQIAQETGISQMHVSRLLSRTLATLRAGLAEQEAGHGDR